MAEHVGVDPEPFTAFCAGLRIISFVGQRQVPNQPQ